jgi:hypothetical protein
MFRASIRRLGQALTFITLTSFGAAQAPEALGDVVYRESYSTQNGPRNASIVLSANGRFQSVLITYSNRIDTVGPRMRIAAPEAGRFRYVKTSPSTATVDFLPEGENSRLTELNGRTLTFTSGNQGAVQAEYPGERAAGDFRLAPLNPAGMANSSARGLASRTRPLILGFVVSGDHVREVLLRGIGPTLARFGIGDAAMDVRLMLLGDEARTAFFTQNDDWEIQDEGISLKALVTDSGAPGPVEQLTQFLGAFPLPAASRDAALAVSLGPGMYTLEVYTKAEAPAEVFGEVYVTP